ncbi:MAG TPA: Hsp20/alpha crystallin family protein [Cytophagaceae bacterium]|jgi:HSP20 family protein
MTLVKNNSELNGFIPTSFTDIIDNFFKDSVNNNEAKILKFFPKVDIVEDEQKYEIHLAIPGMKKEEFKIDLADGKLLISGERKFEKSEGSKKYHILETQYGAFQRAFYLPEKANAEAIEAAYNDGILLITIPKDEKKIAKATIQVK